MKTLFFFLLCILPSALLFIKLPVSLISSAFTIKQQRSFAAQTSQFVVNTHQERIERVENGLTGVAILPEGKKNKTMNLLERMKYYKVNGMSIAVIDKSEIAWSKAYGVIDVSTKEPVTSQTLFQTASIGKVITALAALQLVKAGKITLDEDVNLWLTSWKVPENQYTEKEKVTLRRLLNHSAGFVNDEGFAGYAPTDSVPTLKQILNHQAPTKGKEVLIGRIPGPAMQYSGFGYLVIQQLVEDLSGTPFQTYVEKEIFSKLDLPLSTYNFYPDQTLGLKVARGHDEDGKIDKLKKYHIYPEAGAAGFWSTASELAKILIQMQQEENGQSDLILNQSLMHQMLSPQFESNNRGLGVALMGRKQTEGFAHAGSNAGYQCIMYATTATGQGAVVLTNSDEGINLAMEVIRSIANEYQWPFLQTQYVKDIPLESQKQYLGKFRSKEGLSFIIGESKKGLTLQMLEPGQAKPRPAVNLYWLAQQSFVIKEAPEDLLLSFTLDSTKQAKSILLEKYAGAKMILEKVN